MGVLRWRGADEPVGEEGAEGEAGPGAGAGEDVAGREVVADADRGAAAGGAADASGEAEPPWTYAEVVDARSEDAPEDGKLILLDEQRYRGLTDVDAALARARAHAEKVRSPNLQNALLAAVEITAAICAKVR